MLYRGKDDYTYDSLNSDPEKEKNCRETPEEFSCTYESELYRIAHSTYYVSFSGSTENKLNDLKSFPRAICDNHKDTLIDLYELCYAKDGSQLKLLSLLLVMMIFSI